MKTGFRITSDGEIGGKNNLRKALNDLLDQIVKQHRQSPLFRSSGCRVAGIPDILTKFFRFFYNSLSVFNVVKYTAEAEKSSAQAVSGESGKEAAKTARQLSACLQLSGDIARRQAPFSLQRAGPENHSPACARHRKPSAVQGRPGIKSPGLSVYGLFALCVGRPGKKKQAVF